MRARRLSTLTLLAISISAGHLPAQPDSTLTSLLSSTTATFIDRTGRDIPSHQPGVIGVQAYTVRVGEQLQTLLRRRGIEPNGNAYTFVYAANPGLQNVDRLSAGQLLLLPTIEGPSVAEAALGRRYLARLGVYGALRQQLVLQADAVSRSVSEILRSGENLIPDAYRSAAIPAVRRLWHTLEGLEFERAVVGEQMLEIMNFELDVATALLSRTTGTDMPLDAETIQLLLAIEASFSELATCALTAVKCEVGVQVRTLRANGTPMMGVQVYAAPFAMVSEPRCETDPRCRRPFRRVSSPAEHNLPAGAHFVIWAEQDGQIISDRKSFRPNRTGPNEVDLLLTQP